MKKTIVLIAFSALALSSCAQQRPATIIDFHMPGSGPYHLKVEIKKGGEYTVVKRFKSYHVSDPDEGVKIRRGRVGKRQIDDFLSTLRDLRLGNVEQRMVDHKLASHSKRMIVADGGDYGFIVHSRNLDFSYTINGITMYAENYPDIPELQQLVAAIPVFRAFGELLFEKGEP